jgi:diguanylate cyclase (GGDEF)-like protein/PAS domain S-box-containing protein
MPPVAFAAVDLADLRLALDVAAIAACAMVGFVWFFWHRHSQVAARALESTRAELEDTAADRDMMQAIAENANDGLLYQDMSARIIWANPAYCRIMGYELSEIVGRNPQEFCFPPDARPSDAAIRDFRFDPNDRTFGSLHRHPNLRKNGELFWHEFSQAMTVAPNGERRVILVSRDVTEQVAREQELERARAELQFSALHDALTGLPNRTAFLTAASARLDRRRGRGALGLLYVDLDGFKTINDTHGHAAGDRVLRHVADAIRAACRDAALTCRMGGDEYVIACDGVDDFEDLQFIAEDFLDRLREPVPWKDMQLRADASVGMALAGPDITLAEDLIRLADFALYEAKRPGSPSIVRYDADLHARREAERAVLREFSEALDTQAIDFAYQPVFDAASGRIASFETLARWRRANGENVPPDRFLRYAQRLNRIADIDFAAIRATARLTAELRAAGHDLRGAFNTSSAALAHPDFLSVLADATAVSGLSPDDLTAEVLETTFFGPCTTDSLAAARITELRGAGYQVYLDDFGVGYAGLAHLGQLDITGVKLDRSLIANLVEETSARIIVSSILHMCDALGVTPLAEGVETAEQADLLVAEGCIRLQGFGVAMPMPKQDLFGLLAKPDPVRLAPARAAIPRSA